mgnify:CR=1 FL=1
MQTRLNRSPANTQDTRDVLLGKVEVVTKNHGYTQPVGKSLQRLCYYDSPHPMLEEFITAMT